MLDLPKLKRDWPGIRLRATKPVKNGWMEMPRGSRWTIASTTAGRAHLKADPCEHCGIRATVTVMVNAGAKRLCGFETLELARLKPSTQAPIDLETLRELPSFGWYHVEGEGTARTHRWSGEEVKINRPDGDRDWLLARAHTWRYLKLPRLSFASTTEAISTLGDQPSGRCKSVTRRKPPAGKARIWKPGDLFLAVDKLRTKAARGLGVFEVVSAEVAGRWACPGCRWAYPTAFEPTVWAGCPDWYSCQRCGTARKADNMADFDTLTPAELELEGLPDLTGDEFWRLLETAGNVVDGKTYRIEFKAVL